MSSIMSVREKVQSMQGKTISMEVNKGRNKIVRLSAIITEVYPSMFVIKPMEIVDLDRKSYSYNDVLCGDVKFI